MNTSDTEFAPVWVVGFMSGTSIDAVDAAMIRTDGERVFEYGPVFECKYDDAQRTILQTAIQAARDWNWQGAEPVKAYSEALDVLTKNHVAAYEGILAQWDGPTPEYVGVHGQTVLHRAPKAEKIGATRQIFDAPIFAQTIQRPVIFDFRTADVLAGGQGAPLAPIYHKALVSDLGEGPHAVLNLGGVANITWINDDLIGFDCGPANGPIDEWVEGHGRGTYDAEGRFAAAGSIHEGLLAQWLDHPFFGEAPPKSLDRFDFDANLARGLGFEDGCATLAAFSARAVAIGLSLCPSPPKSLTVCGGGRRNPTIMQMLADACPCAVQSAEDAGWRGDSIEAEAFALLAVRTLRGLPISFPGTTGVQQPMSGGEVQAF